MSSGARRIEGRIWALGLAASLSLGAAGWSQAGQEPAALTPEQQAQMAAFMKAMTPGAPHQHLTKMAGTWEGTVTLWEDPTQPPTVSQARAERTVGLGGRVLIDHWNGVMMGMPFEGMGMTGFDNVSGKWWGTWSDNFGTGVMTGEGTCAADMKSCTFSMSSYDPMTGKPAKNRQVTSWPSTDEERMQMFMAGPDGKEWKAMEIAIRRIPK